MAQIKLLSLPSLDNTYQNVIDFASLAEQSSWFDNKIGRIIEGNIKTDTERSQLVLNTSYGSIKPYDYLYFTNKNGKRIYYFITHKSRRTSDTVIVDVECDVWNTYMFDYELKDSYVDRCHVNRWNGNIPTVNTVDEGIPIGEIKYSSFKLIKVFNNNYIMTSNLPLGKLSGEGGGGDPGAIGGMLTKNGFRFIKGFEGFGAYAYKGSGESFYTAGYGITEPYQPDYFNMLKPFPCSEYKASEVFGKMVIDRFVTPVKNKMTADGFNPDRYPSKYFDVFVSHAMNAGYSAWSNGAVYEAFKQGASPQDMANIIKGWYTNGGLPGLVARRKAEADIWLNGVYEKRAIVTINQDGSYGPAVTENGGNGYIPPEFTGTLT